MRSLTKAMRGINPGYGQFRWVVLLLAIAVVLPTLCLLWFMNEVVKSERLAVRQRLTSVYKAKLAEATDQIEQRWADRCRVLEGRPAVSPYRQLVAAVGQFDYAGLLIYDGAGRRLYPTLSADNDPATSPFAGFGDAVEMEVRQQYEQAVERYEQYARITDNQDRLAAWISKARALVRLDRLDEAVTECQRAAGSPLAQTGDSRCLSLIANARLLLLSWLKDKPAYAELYDETFAKLLSVLYRDNEAGFALAADENLFLARKAIEIGRENGRLDRYAALFDGAALADLIDAEERSIALAQKCPTLDAFSDWEVGKLRSLAPDSNDFYGMIRPSGRGMCVAVVSRDNLVGVATDFVKDFQDDNVACAVFDETGRIVAGSGQGTREPFAADMVGRHLPGWKIVLLFKGGDVFERAASDRIALYTWTGLLVIGLILGCGGVAAKSIGKQVRLNKLKNDFIATVTHELKTPLASMRVLVDTLLEGSYSNPNQVMEYLQLVSKENERLSRLIDNFLTFSRMERNKQAFQMRPVGPTSIARTAAQAVQTKLGRGRCQFETDIPDGLPTIKADHDAMVTVLVNLLDNAYKYTYDEKQIRLSVGVGFKSARTVSFVVSDNGVGVPRRALKKIFRRFYQVDRSLSRRAEGCGLGLSIAKFIVDAHHGRITVESKLGQGSTFTVTLPVDEAAD
ncbi:MAG: HAMP domain-containing sensor histidine kinase [Phycisphaerales bacterium]